MKPWVSGSLVVVSVFITGGAGAGPVPDDGSSASAGIPPSAPKRAERFFDPDDGWLDLSSFLDQPNGFVPLINPITEPALGTGLMFAPVFIQTNEPTPDGKPVRPNISTVGGFRTNSDSQGVFAAHSGVWMDGRLQTLVAGIDASLNLDFYGLGLGLGGGRSVQYELDATGGLVEGRYRLGKSPWMLGLRYLYAEIDSTFKVTLPPGVFAIDLDSRLGGPSAIINYDTRDNIFTPNKGTLAELSATFHDPMFGASSTHQRIDLVGIHYHPLRDDLVLGVRGNLSSAFGDSPFYANPYVELRGVPALRYQGEIATSVEAELRWRFWKRFSLIVFGGVGAAANDWGDFDSDDLIFAGGAGVRYELARRYGLHMGIDVGFSEEDTAVYITFGSAWMRP